jgi:site-specific recombinase XerD
MSDPTPDRLGLWPGHRDDLILANRSPLTIRDRRSVLAKVTRGAVDLADLTAADIRSFIARPELKPATRATYLAHCHSLFKWAIYNGHVTHDPTVKIPTIKVNPGLPRPISHADLRRALDTATPNVRAWLMLGAFAGLRCAEAATLHRDNVRGRVLVVTGKGNKTRAIPIHPELEAVLAQLPASGYLFPGGDHGHAAPKTVSSAVGEHLRNLGINSTAHATRHRFGTDIYRVNQDLRATQVLLGHASTRTTEVYTEVDRPALEAMVGALNYGTG